MSTNDVTGDRLVSKVGGKSYGDNFDLIFRKQVEDLDSTAVDMEDAAVGHHQISDEDLFSSKKK